MLRRLLVFALVWGGIVGLFTLQLHVGADMPARNAFVRTLLRWSPWIILTPFVFWLAARYPLTQLDRLFKHSVIHVAISFVGALSAQMFSEAVALPMELRLTRAPLGDVARALQPGGAENRKPPRRPRRPSLERPPGRGPLSDQLADRPGGGPPGGGPPGGGPPGGGPPGGGPPGGGPPGGGPPGGPGIPAKRTLLGQGVHHLSRTLPTYWALMGIQSMLLFGAQLRQRERHALELQAKLTQSQLDTLKLQLQPHFLFNALNAISTLVYREPKTADKMIGNLSTLLRGVLDEKNSNELPLSRELELLSAYLAIEQMRFGDRVQFEREIPNECLQARVPTLFLQPIVENAVRHGLEPSGKPGTIWLSVRKKEDHLQICVEDNGVGRQSPSTKGWGIGLSNAEARLEALYGRDSFSLELSDRDGGGTVVTVTLPFQTSLS